ncbi:MAG: hypothetical protein ACRD2G_03175 [Terriglobia bacterium]
MPCPKKNWIFAALLLCSVLVMGAAAKQSGPNGLNGRVNGSHWVGTWAAAPQLGDAGNTPPAPGFRGVTLRQIVRVSIGGKKLRVRFSNAFGTTALTITSAHVAVAAGGGSIIPGSDKALTFDGQPSVNIPPGAPMISDATGFNPAPLSDLAVTIPLE